MRRAAILGAIVAVLVGALFARAAVHRPIVVTYYFIPGCSTCERTSGKLRAIVAPYGDAVRLRLVENRSAEGLAAARAHGFASHGLVVRGGDGAPAVVEADHRVFPEHVAAALARLTAR